MDSIRLRLPQHDQPDLALGPGLHGLVPTDGALALAPADDAPVQLRVDRRGLWLAVAPGAAVVHVNGRPVRRLAMLRAGDAVHVDGVPVQLLGDTDVPRTLPDPKAAPATGAGARLVLRGVGGQHHGRCFELSRPRIVGRLQACDIRIDAPALAERHARLEPVGDRVALRALAGASSQVNGIEVRDALLAPGDQVVFDAHHRFVVEAPGRPQAAPGHAADVPPTGGDAAQATAPRRLRMPWLLLAAVLLAAALAGLLLFGAP